MKMEESKYKKLEAHVAAINLESAEKTRDKMPPEVQKYFEGFGDKIISIREMSSGLDSIAFIVKFRGFENRSELVKVYNGLGSVLHDNKKDLIPVLKKYFEMSKEVREFLETENNPLNQKISIGGKSFFLRFSVAPNGILVEKNGEVGAWIREWIPKDNFTETEMKDSEKQAVSLCVKDTCHFLTSKFDYDIRPSSFNYRVFVDEKSGIIKIVFTDLADYILKFVRARPHTIY